MADQAAGGQGSDTTARCLPLGMPRAMTTIFPLEFIITAKIAYILFDNSNGLPRHTFDNSGIPFHKDGLTVIKEKFYLDKAKPDDLVNEITTVDPALTRPWSTIKPYRLEREKPVWSENACTQDNGHVFVGKENYMISADGFLMPARRDQPPPDTRYFKR